MNETGLLSEFSSIPSATPVFYCDVMTVDKCLDYCSIDFKDIAILGKE